MAVMEAKCDLPAVDSVEIHDADPHAAVAEVSAVDATAVLETNPCKDASSNVLERSDFPNNTIKSDVLAPPSSPEEVGQRMYSKILTAVFRECGLFADESRQVLDIQKQIAVYHHAAQLFKLRGAVLAALVGASADSGRPTLQEGVYARAVACVKNEITNAGVQLQPESLKRVFGAHAIRSVDLPTLPKGCSGGSVVCLKQRPMPVTSDLSERGLALRFSCESDPLSHLEEQGGALLLTVAGAAILISPQLADLRSLDSADTLDSFLARDKDAWAALLQKSAVAFTKASANIIAASVRAKPPPSQPPATPEKRRDEPSCLGPADSLVTPQKLRETGPAASPMASPTTLLREAQVQPELAGQRVYAALLAAVFWELGLYAEGPGGWLDVRKQLLVYRHAAKLEEIKEFAASALQPKSSGEEGLPALYAKAIEVVRADPLVRADLEGITAEAIFDKQHAIHFASPAGVPLGRHDVCIHLQELPLASGYGQRKTASWWRYLFKFRCARNPLVLIEEQALALVLLVKEQTLSSFSVVSPLLSQPEQLEKVASVPARSLGGIGQALEGVLPAFISEQGPAWAQFTLWHSDIIQRDSLRVIQKTIRFIKQKDGSEEAVDPCFGALEELKRLEAARQQISQFRETEVVARATLQEYRQELDEQEDGVGTLLEKKFDLLDNVHRVQEKAATKKRHLESLTEETQAARQRVTELALLLKKEKATHKKLLQRVNANEGRIASLQPSQDDAAQDFDKNPCDKLRAEAAAANDEAEKAVAEAAPAETLRAELAKACVEAKRARAEAERAEKRASDRVGKAADLAAETKRAADKTRANAEGAAARTREEVAQVRADLESKSAETARLSASNVALREDARSAREDADRTSQHAAAATAAAFDAQDSEQHARDALAKLATVEGTAEEQLAERMSMISALSAEVAAARASVERGHEVAQKAEAKLSECRTEEVRARGRQEAQQAEVARLRPAIASLRAEVESLNKELETSLPMRVAAAESGRAEADARLSALNSLHAPSGDSPDEAAKLAAANAALRAEAAKALDEAERAELCAVNAENEAASLRSAEAKIRCKARPGTGIRSRAKELKALLVVHASAQQAAHEAEEAVSAASVAGEHLRKSEVRTRAELQAKSEEVARLSAALAQARASVVELEARQCEAKAVTQLTGSSESLRTQAATSKKEARQANARGAAAEALCARSREAALELVSELEARSSLVAGLAISADAAQAEAAEAKVRADELVEGELAAELVAAEAHAAQQQAQSELNAMLELAAQLDSKFAILCSAKRRRTTCNTKPAVNVGGGKLIKRKARSKHPLSTASAAVRRFRMKGKQPLWAATPLADPTGLPHTAHLTITPADIGNMPLAKSNSSRCAESTALDVSLSSKRRRRSKGPAADGSEIYCRLDSAVGAD